MFVLLRDVEAGGDTEVEFSDKNQTLRLKPVRWNERVLCVNTPGTWNNNTMVGDSVRNISDSESAYVVLQIFQQGGSK